MKTRHFFISLTAAAFLSALLSSSAWANVKQTKAYKEVYTDAKPKCGHCHAVAKPKKEEGEHDLNDYGKKVQAIKAEPDADTYRQAGAGPADSE